MLCKHCQVRRVCRPRGLCWTCYYTPGVRDRYPETSQFGRRGPGNYYAMPPLPAFPTQARPGSAAKIAVLAERVRRRESLWHPDDATLGGAGKVPALAG